MKSEHGKHGDHDPKVTHHESHEVNASELRESADGDAARLEATKKLREETSGRVEKPSAALSPELQRRLQLDLLTNKTAEYSRINLTEIFVAFNYDVDHTITHWRLAKIMDAITICKDEIKILKSGLSPGGVIGQVVEAVRKGEADDPKIEISIEKNEALEEAYPGIHPTEKASLADLVYFMDVMKMNRELGPSRLPLKELTWKFFAGVPLTVDVKVPGKNKDDEMTFKKIDLADKKMNPRDEYAKDEIDVDGYKKAIKDNQSGLQMVGDWRHESAGHRELAGHAFITKMDDTMLWIPLSGRMAARISKEDMQKNSAEGGRAALTGQPQELGEMDEDRTGAIVRFRLTDLVQRRVGSDVNRLSGTTRRMMKAMVGLTLNEEAYADEESDENKKGGKHKVVWLGGKTPGKIVDAMHAHYDAPMKKIRGEAMTDEEAYDTAFLDVFLPCLLNNENDWYVSLANVYDVGGPQKARGIINNPDKFADFELKIKCLYLEDKDGHKEGDIDWQTFHSMKELRKYYLTRVQLGHMDQAINFDVGDPDKIDPSVHEKVPAFKSVEVIESGLEKQYSGLLHDLLGEYAESTLDSYVKGYAIDSLRPELNTDEKWGELIPFSKKENVEGRVPLTFDQIVKIELDKWKKEGKISKLFVYFDAILGSNLSQDDDLLDDAILAVVNTLKILERPERAKINK